MKKAGKIIGTILLVVLCIIFILLGVIYFKFRELARGTDPNEPIIAEDYQKNVQTGGELEAKYLQNGSYETAYAEYDADEPIIKHEFFYPKEMETSNKKYPVIVYCNGSTVKGSDCTALFEHWA